MKSLFLAGAALALGLMAVAPSWAADAPVPAVDRKDAIRPDPAVRRGVLPNGVRYLLMRNANPAGAVSVRLAMDVGSFQEADSERGWAHFIEHMAFRASRHYPEGASDHVFAPWGVAFGRDQNAATTLFATTFQLDMPKPDAKQLKVGMSWLRDVADGISFTDEGVKRERGVVLAEMEARSSEILAAQQTIGRFQGETLRSVNRSPIGLSETLNAATAADLKRFYDRWYRPESAVVVIVGDLDLDRTEALVREAFTGWIARGPRPQQPPFETPRSARDLEALAVSGETLPITVTACRTNPGAGRPTDTIANRRTTIHRQIWQTILNQRLARVINQGQAPLVSAMMGSNDVRDLSIACLLVMPTGDAWDSALDAAQVEVNRFAKDGPTDLETETTVENLRGQLRGVVLTSASRSSSAIANDLVAGALENQVSSSPADTLYAFDLAVEDMTPEDVKAQFGKDWSGSGPLLSITGAKPPTKEALAAAWTRGEGHVLQERYADQAKPAWAYQAFGKAGKVIDRKVIEQPGFSRLKFSNGVVLNFKPTKITPNKVEVRVRFGAGQHQIADTDYPVALFGSKLLTAGGLGRHSIEDIQKIYGNSTLWGLSLTIGPTAFEMRTSGLDESLEDQIAVLAAYLSDAGFRRAIDARIPTAIDFVFRSYLTQPSMALNLAVMGAVSPDAASNMPPREVLEKMRSADFERVLKPVLTTEPLELTIVGDAKEDEVIALVARTFGALPARNTAGRRTVEPHFVRFPATAPPTIRVEHQGQGDKAAAALIWPLYVATPERRREEYSLKLLAAIFDSALRRRVREELGKTYAPAVLTNTPDYGDQGSLIVAIDASPADIETLVAEARAVAARLVSGDITPAALEEARAPMIAGVETARGNLGWWAGAMSGSARESALLEEYLQYGPLMGAVTLDDVKTAAVRWLKPDPIVGVAQPAAAKRARP
ncbi:MAG TPA: insulinase family protein [Caulobacter sp.]|nr:insulinase family protein [Caulobacter sp.]